jgi:hypothetical protein
MNPIKYFPGEVFNLILENGDPSTLLTSLTVSGSSG